MPTPPQPDSGLGQPRVTHQLAGHGIIRLKERPTMGPGLTFVRALAAKDNETTEVRSSSSIADRAHGSASAVPNRIFSKIPG